MVDGAEYPGLATVTASRDRVIVRLPSSLMHASSARRRLSARRWAALGFAAALAAPAGLARFCALHAQDVSHPMQALPHATAPATQPFPASGVVLSGKQYYEKGAGQYRDGDWVAARQNLQLALRAGYKP